MTDKPADYESHLIKLMRDYDLTLLEAICFDLEAELIDVSSVFAICDYLEEKLVDLDKVQYYMMVYTGQSPDVQLKRNV